MYINEIIRVTSDEIKISKNGNHYSFFGIISDNTKQDENNTPIFVNCYIPKTLNLALSLKKGSLIFCKGDLSFKYRDRNPGSRFESPTCHTLFINSFRFISTRQKEETNEEEYDNNDIGITKQLMHDLAI